MRKRSARPVKSSGSPPGFVSTTGSPVSGIELIPFDSTPDIAAQARVVTIGPITAATAREFGLRVDVVATEHTIAGLIDAITTMT